MNPRGTLLVLIGLSACNPGADRGSPRATRMPARSAAPVVGDTVATACRDAVAWWHAILTPPDSGRVTALDTVEAPPFEAHPTPVCVVRVSLSHGMRAGQPAWGGSDDSLPGALRQSGAGWRRLVAYVADGPDGSVSGYQRAQVRCAVAQSWDGGDDADSTYVAEDWYRQELTCWPAPDDGTAQ